MKITIVIPNFNGGKYLEETICSVLEQDYPFTELIVIDGGSTDNSLAIIQKYEQNIAYWVSEPDRGQAHAINKGLDLATGDIFDWMNSDDRIAPGAFHRVAEAFEANPHSFVVCGYMTYFSGNNFQTPVRMNLYDQLEKTIVYGSMSAPSMYFRLDKFKEVGGLDERLHYCFDLEFWCRFLEKYGQEKLYFIEENLCFFRLHPSSKTVGHLAKFGEEQFVINQSIIRSFHKNNQSIISSMPLEIPHTYDRNWHFPHLSPSLFTALSIQRALELLHHKLSFFDILKWSSISWKLAPPNRGGRFYFLPLRAVRWKLLARIGLNPNWVSKYKQI